MERPTPVKDAAVHRLAKSITQLTLCQVTTSEVDDAFFFRPTPYGFRQVVHHVSKHVAYEIN